MAYKFQLGAAVLSGSLTQEGGITAEGSALSGSSLNVGTAVLSEAELEVLDGASVGSAVASKALIVDSSRDVDSINRLTAAELGAFQANGAIDFNSQALTNVDINSGVIDNVVIGASTAVAGTFTALQGTVVTATSAFTGSLSGSVVQGTMANFGAGGISTQGNVEGVDAIFTTLSASSTLDVQGAARFGPANSAIIAADGGLTIDHFDANWTNAGRTVADLGNVTTVAINGGSIDATVIGGTTPAAGTFTTLSGSGAATLASLHVDSVNIDGGAIDGTAIGAASPSTAVFTTISGSGAATLASLHSDSVNLDGGNIDGTIIGAASAAAITGTVITANSAFTGSLSGSVVQGTMANFGAGGVSTQGNVEGVDAIFTTLSASSTLDVVGAARFGPADSAIIAADGGLTIDHFDANWTNAGRTVADLGTVSAATSITSTDFVGRIGNSSAAAGTFTTLDCNNGAFSIDNLDIDGATDIGAALVDADLFVVDDGAGGSNRKSVMSRIPTYLNDHSNLTSLTNLISVGALSTGSISSNFGNIDIGSSTLDAGVTTVSSLTASYARITTLDVVTINSVAQTEETLEVSDKLIVSALSASSTNSDGGGLRIGGGASSAGHAGLLWDHSNSALDFNIGGTTEIRLQDGVLRPETDNDVDLGASGAEFKDLYIDGIAYLDGINFNGTAIAATAAEINILDSGAGSAMSLQDADSVLFFDNSTGDNVKKTTVAKLKDHVQNQTVQNIANGGDFVRGMNYFSAAGSAVSASLPLEPAVGHVVQIKAPSDCSQTNFVKITKNSLSSHTIDGLTEIILESPNAAVSAMYVSGNVWKIF
jgi:hypothetical protein